MWLDLLALAVLGGFAVFGAARGALASGAGLAALGAGYASGGLAAARGGEAVAGALGLPLWLGLPLAGTAGFLAAFALVSVVGRRLARRERERLAGLPRSPRDRFLGGVFGGVRGALVVLLLSWLALWVDALRVSGDGAPLPPVGRSAAAALTGAVVEAGVHTALRDAGSAGRLAARVAARPAAALGGLRTVFEDDRVATLRDDALFWTYVEHGAYDSALNRASFHAIAHDDVLRGRLGELGLVEAGAAADPAAFRQAAREVLAEVGPRIQGLRDDPEIAALLEDPEIAALVREGDTFGLVRHPEVRRVAARVAGEP